MISIPVSAGMGGFSAKEIAYLVGHATDERCYESYGSTLFGNIGANLPTATHITEADLNQIAEKLESKTSGSNSVKETLPMPKC